MNKSIVASAAIAGALILSACTEEAKADVAIYGQVEQEISTSNSSSNIVGDNVLGFRASETFADGNSAFAVIEFGVDDDASTGNTISNRETYVGLGLGDVTVQAGKMKNLKKSMVNAIDAFDSNVGGFSVDGASRVANTVAAKAEVAGVTIAASTILDGTANSNEVAETRELGAAVELGGVNLAAVVTTVPGSDNTVIYAADADVAGINLAVAHEPDLSNKTTTVVGSIDLGSNTVRLGNSFVDGGNNTMVAEVAHNFSKSTSVFANYSKTENSDPAVGVGLGMRF